MESQVFKFYIAGPMTGMPDDNRPAFEMAERDLYAMFQEPGMGEIEIFNPINHEASLMVQTGQVRDTQEAYRMCLAIDFEWICKHATHMFFLKGWEQSKGARAEHALGQALGLEFWYEE